MPRSRWVRRVLAVMGVFVALCVLTSLSPVWVPVALALDAVRWLRSRRPFMAMRLVTFALVYVLSECVGVLALACVWLFAGFGARRGGRLVEWTYAVQSEWAWGLFRAARALLGLRFEIEGDAAASSGPLVLLVRHASLLDTLIPTVFLTRRHGMRLRFVLKRELLVSPCLDIAGHRLPNAFVDRSSVNSEREVRRIRDLAQGLGAHEGVLIYPEGTIFTPEKRARAQEKLRTSDPERAARASAWKHVLPPRLGGPLALLDGAPDADVLVVGHRGLEGLAVYADLLRGDLVGNVVRVKCWRVPRGQIPTEQRARIEWLDAQWSALDTWLGAVDDQRAHRA